MDSGTGSTRARHQRRLLEIGGATALVAVLGLGLSAVLGGADETGAGVPGRAGSGGSTASSTPGHSPGASHTRAPRSDETLSLGAADVPETRTVREVAPGITYMRINRGRPLERADRIGTSTTGPWVVHAVTIDPDVAVGRLATSHGPSLARPETTTDLAEFAGAVVAVNAAYFPHSDDSVPPSDPGGLAIRAGQILSEPSTTAREDDLIFDASTGSLRITKTKWAGSWRMRTGRAVTIDQLNHPPTVPTACGRMTDQRSCTQLGSVARFTRDYGARTPSGPGVELVLDARGCITTVHRTRGVALGRGQTSIQATGLQVRTMLALGTGCGAFKQSLADGDGTPIRVTPYTFAVNGRGVLVRDGRAVSGPDLDDAFHGRNPRTLAGVDGSGRWVMAVVEGRDVTSVGTTMAETSALALDLGLVDALNLDGGGSSAMVIDGRLVNKVAGGTTQRLVSNALVWLPSTGH